MIKLDHLVLKVSDLSTALPFYRALFEFADFTEVTDPSSNQCLGYRQADGLTIWIEAAEENRSMPKAGSLDHYAFHCESRDRVNQAFTFCQQKGWKILSEPKTYPLYGDFYGFAFEGPDQLKIEFVTR